MLRHVTTGLACIFLIGVQLSQAPAQTWPPTNENALEDFREWLRANSKHGPDSSFVNDMWELAKDEVEQGMTINFFFGSDLMESGNFISVSLFASQFIVFDMTSEQAAAMDLETTGVTTTSAGSKSSPAEKQSFELSDFRVNDVHKIGRHSKFSGEIRFKSLGEVPENTYALRVSYRGNDGISQLFYLDKLVDASGELIPFEFDAINDEDAEADFVGPIALLFDIVTINEADDYAITTHSNLVGVLATVIE